MWAITQTGARINLDLVRQIIVGHRGDSLATIDAVLDYGLWSTAKEVTETHSMPLGAVTLKAVPADGPELEKYLHLLDELLAKGSGLIDFRAD